MTTAQKPSGGCDNCGGPVRTRKSNGWVCAKCERRIQHALVIDAWANARAATNLADKSYWGEIARSLGGEM